MIGIERVTNRQSDSIVCHRQFVGSNNEWHGQERSTFITHRFQVKRSRRSFR